MKSTTRPKSRNTLLKQKPWEFEILSPDVNVSEYNFTPAGEAIRFGLGAIKGIGQSAVSSIIAARQSETNRLAAGVKLYSLTFTSGERISIPMAFVSVMYFAILAGVVDFI